jgi:hypothetical protein
VGSARNEAAGIRTARATTAAATDHGPKPDRTVVGSVGVATAFGSTVRWGREDGGRTTYSGTPHRGHRPIDPATVDHSQRKHTATGPVATERAYARLDQGMPGPYRASIDRTRHVVKRTVAVGLVLAAAMMPGPAAAVPPDCTLLGTGGNDRLIGTEADEVICGLGGRDFIKGKAGDDQVRAGGGNDTVILGPGADEAFGQAGHDILDGNGGNDILRGQGGNDFLRGFAGSDMLEGGPKSDCLYATDGIGGNDVADGGTGTDTHDVDNGDTLVNAEQAGSCAGD